MLFVCQLASRLEDFGGGGGNVQGLSLFSGVEGTRGELVSYTGG